MGKKNSITLTGIKLRSKIAWEEFSITRGWLKVSR